MNPFERIGTSIAHKLGIYPHDGKNVIFIRDEELHQGLVMGSSALTGHTKLELARETHILDTSVAEAAAALRVKPEKIQQRLKHGEMVMYRQPK